jgi:murein DD-endopeptidase MepM/ murein hydrolase activator NlpD
LAALWFFRDADLVRFARATVAHSSPHREYTASLERTGLSETALGREWLAAASRAVAEPASTTLPFTRASVVAAGRPAAIGYAIALKRGQRLDVTVVVAADAPAQAFVDVFERDAVGSPVPRAAGLRALAFEPRADSRLIVRVQPELLRGGHLTVRARAAPALRFPVSGARASDLHSVFGDDRDAGRRRHEGVDIFAKRGTPVLAASDGIVTRVNETAIGGRVVWVWDPSRSLSIYYAHLDRQRVATGARVRAGDVVGTVGNTGNARTTAPHLHFGIYEAGRGAIDPDPFIRPAKAGPF